MSEPTHTHGGGQPEIAFSGWFEGRTHLLPIRVYYEDTDASGIVYHANYLRFFERGRSDFLRLAGVRHLIMMEGDVALAWTLRRINLDYRRPARIDDLLYVRTRYTELAGARMNGEQEIVKGDDILCTATIEAAIMTLEGRPRRIPADIRARMEPFLSPPNTGLT